MQKLFQHPILTRILLSILLILILFIETLLYHQLFVGISKLLILIYYAIQLLLLLLNMRLNISHLIVRMLLYHPFQTRQHLIRLHPLHIRCLKLTTLAYKTHPLITSSLYVTQHNTIITLHLLPTHLQLLCQCIQTQIRNHRSFQYPTPELSCLAKLALLAEAMSECRPQTGFGLPCLIPFWREHQFLLLLGIYCHYQRMSRILSLRLQHITIISRRLLTEFRSIGVVIVQ